MQHGFYMNAGYPYINPVGCGKGTIAPKDKWGPVAHAFWNIHFVLHGCGRYTINNQVYDIYPGQMFVSPPYVEHTYEADPINPWEYIWISFVADAPLPVDLTYVISRPAAQSIFEKMYQAESKEGACSAYLVSQIWKLFTLLIAKDIQQEDHVDKAIEYIHHEYVRNISVQDIANHVNLDRAYFSTLFRKKMGMPPSKYLLNYRMNMAISLLTEHNKSVSVVANSLGYSDVFSFSKVFKRYFGVSPQTYKNKPGKK